MSFETIRDINQITKNIVRSIPFLNRFPKINNRLVQARFRTGSNRRESKTITAWLIIQLKLLNDSKEFSTKKLSYIVNTFLAQVEVDHGGDGVYGDEELALVFTHLAELVEQRKVLCEVLQVWLGSVFHLKQKCHM